MMNQYFGSWAGPAEGLAPALERVGTMFPDKMVVISEFGLAGPFAPDTAQADRMRIGIMESQLAEFAKHDFVAGAIFWCYQDYKSHRNLWPGLTTDWVEMGVVDENRQRLPSYAAWKERTSPARVGVVWTRGPGGPPDRVPRDRRAAAAERSCRRTSCGATAWSGRPATTTGRCCPRGEGAAGDRLARHGRGRLAGDVLARAAPHRARPAPDRLRGRGAHRALVGVALGRAVARGGEEEGPRRAVAGTGSDSIRAGPCSGAYLRGAAEVPALLLPAAAGAAYRARLSQPSARTRSAASRAARSWPRAFQWSSSWRW